MARLKMGYPDFNSQVRILRDRKGENPLNQVSQAVDAAAVRRMQGEVDSLNVADSIYEYITHLAQATREHAVVQLGVSPRGALAVLKMAQARAYVSGRDYVLPEDAAVLFNDCDHYFRCDALARLDARADGALLTFRSRDPRFSFVQLDERGLVLRTAEKEAISDRAICGAYYFGSVRTFRTAAARYLETCTQSEFFMSGVYNALLAAHGAVEALETQVHVSFGTPEEYEAARHDARLEGAEA